MITATGAIHRFHNEHLGTPQVLTNASGAVMWQSRDDAFGKATLLVNAVEQPLRFPGQVVDCHVPEGDWGLDDDARARSRTVPTNMIRLVPPHPRCTRG